MKIGRTQIPLLAANGMTIAKSQGSSLPKVVCIRDSLTRELKYVACSRSTSLEGLHIVGKFQAPSLPPPNDPVTKEMEILRKLPVEFRLRFPSDFPDMKKLYYHNVEGFLSHHLDILNDINIMAHEYLVFSEPRIKAEYELGIEGFTILFRQNSSVKSGFCNSEGLLVFHKSKFQ